MELTCCQNLSSKEQEASLNLHRGCPLGVWVIVRSPCSAGPGFDVRPAGGTGRSMDGQRRRDEGERVIACAL